MLRPLGNLPFCTTNFFNFRDTTTFTMKKVICFTHVHPWCPYAQSMLCSSWWNNQVRKRWVRHVGRKRHWVGTTFNLYIRYWIKYYTTNKYSLFQRFSSVGLLVSWANSVRNPSLNTGMHASFHYGNEMILYYYIKMISACGWQVLHQSSTPLWYNVYEQQHQLLWNNVYEQ